MGNIKNILTYLYLDIIVRFHQALFQSVDLFLAAHNLVIALLEVCQSNMIRKNYVLPLTNTQDDLLSTQKAVSTYHNNTLTEW